MPAAFNRDSMAVFYAKRHKETDPAICEIHYLPTGAPANEIRFVEVNGCINGTASPEPSRTCAGGRRTIMSRRATCVPFAR
jgi:hypothetical protein